MLFLSARQHASITWRQPRHCFEFRRVPSTPSDVPPNSPSISFIPSAAPDALVAAPGFATTAVLRFRASVLRGVTDVVCRRPTLVASAHQHPQNWNRSDRSDHLTGGCAARSFNSNIMESGQERRTWPSLWPPRSYTCNESTRSSRCLCTPLDSANGASTNRCFWLSRQEAY